MRTDSNLTLTKRSILWMVAKKDFTFFSGPQFPREKPLESWVDFFHQVIFICSTQGDRVSLVGQHAEPTSFQRRASECPRSILLLGHGHTDSRHPGLPGGPLGRPLVHPEPSLEHQAPYSKVGFFWKWES